MTKVIKHILSGRSFLAILTALQVHDFGRIILSPTLAKVGLHQPDSRGSKTLHAPQTETMIHKNMSQRWFFHTVGDHSNWNNYQQNMSLRWFYHIINKMKLSTNAWYLWDDFTTHLVIPLALNWWWDWNWDNFTTHLVNWWSLTTHLLIFPLAPLNWWLVNWWSLTTHLVIFTTKNDQ